MKLPSSSLHLRSEVGVCVCMCVHAHSTYTCLQCILCWYTAVESIAALGSIPRVPPRRSLPGWEVKVLAAQNIIFNQELFSQVHVSITDNLCTNYANERGISLLLPVTAADERSLQH